MRSKSRQRSRVANGTALLNNVDGRNAWVRRAKEIISDHLSDLAGEENTSAAERSIIRRVAALTVELERMEEKFALAGEARPDEIDLYARVAANLRRLLEAVGLERRSKPVQSLDEYLRQRRVGGEGEVVKAAE